MSVLVDSIEIQLSSKRLVRTHTGKVKRHDGLFESDLAVNLEGFTTGQPRDNVIKTFLLDVLKKVVHLVRKMFWLPFHSDNIGIVDLEGLLVSEALLGAVRRPFE